MKRPGRADITPTRSESIAASSSACVIEEHGRAGLAPQAQQLIAHQQARLLVERAERLVEQDEPRLQDERARDANTLAHAAGELRRIRAHEIGEPHEGERVVDPAADLARLHAGAAQPERHVVPHAEPGKARVLLEHDPDAVGHARRRSAGLRRVTLPALASCRPARSSSSVDLPQPDGPTTPKNSPRASLKSTGPSACTSRWPSRAGKTLLTPRSSACGSLASCT